MTYTIAAIRCIGKVQNTFLSRLFGSSKYRYIKKVWIVSKRESLTDTDYQELESFQEVSVVKSLEEGVYKANIEGIK